MLPSNFSNEEWLSHRAILTIRNDRLYQRNGRIGSFIPGTLQEILIADFVDEAEVKALIYLLVI